MTTDEEIYKIYFKLSDDLKERFLLYIRFLQNS